MIDGLKKAEEAKRDRNWDARQRWKALQDMIAWAEAQATVRRNTREACLREQARKLRQLDGSP
ncbi:MAG: hypothetical protein H8E44_19070 [Planctomycetes bacterium]|nr:hypothetical protein [Planctomycetota bacterium]